MRFSDEDMDYLSGKKFSIWYKMKLSGNPLMSREECLLSLTRGKRVLHIGCCDHIPVIMEKVKNNKWLHGLLLKNCDFVAGIDINEEAVRFVMENVPCPPPPPQKKCFITI